MGRVADQSHAVLETHLSAAVIGVAMAVILRRRDTLPRMRYSWEEDGEGEEAGAIEVENGEGR